MSIFSSSCIIHVTYFRLMIITETVIFSFTDDILVQFTKKIQYLYTVLFGVCQHVDRVRRNTAFTLRSLQLPCQ